MSLTTTIGAGALIGGIAAFAVYAAVVPGEESVVVPVAATFSPVPTPTITQMAADCEPPAVLTGSECIVTKPGRTVVVQVPTGPTDAPDDSDGRVDARDDGDDNRVRASDDDRDDDRDDGRDEDRDDDRDDDREDDDDKDKGDDD